MGRGYLEMSSSKTDSGQAPSKCRIDVVLVGSLPRPMAVVDIVEEQSSFVIFGTNLVSDRAS